MLRKWHTPEQLWRRYVGALIIVFALLAASHSADSIVLRGADEQATAINVAGRQRMLSQRILYLSAETLRGASPADARLRLKETIASFERGHRALVIGGDLGLATGNAAVRRKTYETILADGRSATTMVEAFTDDAHIIARGGQDTSLAFDRMAKEGSSSLLFALDTAVRAFELAAKEQAAGIERVAHWSFYAAIAVLLFEALLIFLPSHRLVTAALRDLKSSNARAVESRKRAENALAVRTQFMANMSHEIRTPMNGVLGMAQVLATTDLDERQRQLTDVISSSGNALLAVINDVLDFSKLDAGKMSLTPHPFDLRRTVSEVAMLMQARVLDKDVEIIVRYQADLPTWFDGDEGRLRQVISNLVGNAVKFTGQGHVLLDVSGVIDGPDCSLAIKVIDTGIGIDPATLPRVFDKFEQADATGSRAYQGTGLGLTISRDLTTLMGGQITAASELGQGSVFTVAISLPLDDTNKLVGEDHQKFAANVRLLGVDDNAINRMVISELTSAWGMDCSVRDGVDSALEALVAAHHAGEPFDVVVTDYRMPDRDGAELLEAMADDPRFADIPVVVLSSIDVTAERHRRIAARCAALVQKPIRPAFLSQVLTQVLGGGEVPCLKTKAQRDAHDAEAVSATVRRLARVPRPTILLAEDNVVNVMVAKSMMGETEFDIIVAEDGAAAVDAFAAHSPDLVLMDISMPVLDGFGAAEQIRRFEEKNGLIRTPIIAVTANTADDDQDACEAVGMDGFLPKPLRREALLGTLAAWLVPDAERDDDTVYLDNSLAVRHGWRSAGTAA